MLDDYVMNPITDADGQDLSDHSVEVSRTDCGFGLLGHGLVQMSVHRGMHQSTAYKYARCIWCISRPGMHGMNEAARKAVWCIWCITSDSLADT